MQTEAKSQEGHTLGGRCKSQLWESGAQAHAPYRDAASCVFSVFSLATPKPASSLFYSSKDFIAKTSSLSFLLLVSNYFGCSHRRMKMRVDKLQCGWGSSCSTRESGPALGLDSTGELTLLQRCEWTCSENISLGELALFLTSCSTQESGPWTSRGTWAPWRH